MKFWNWLRRAGRHTGVATLFGLLLSVASGTPAQTPDVNALFDWAESGYPTLFAGHTDSQTLAGWVYRCYPTSNCIGVADGLVYLLGPVSNQSLLAIDTLAAFQCLVQPQRCAPVVADIGAAALHYARQAVFTIVGSGLQQNLSVSVNKCSGLKQVASFDERARNISCQVTGTGSLTMDVKDASGTLLLSRSFNVPEPQVLLQTSLGNLLLELNPTAAPLTVNNFLTYVNAGFYADTVFHRVIPGFMVQGGGLTANLSTKTTLAPIALESNVGLSNLRGTIAMARTPAPDSATAQFFINQVDNPGLNYAGAASPGYAVFGRVVQGLEVVDLIAAVPTGSVGSLHDVPLSTILIRAAQQVQ